MDTLYNYMKKVKEIIDSKGLKDVTGRDAMIPAQLNVSNGNPPSIMWSNISMYGYIWTEPPFHVGDRAYYNFQEPWVKNVLQWWNKCYNDGLLDPELFVKKDEQLNEEIIRGRFAIFPDWGALTNDAREFARENDAKFGYRVIACWWPKTFKNTYNDASQPVGDLLPALQRQHHHEEREGRGPGAGLQLAGLPLQRGVRHRAVVGPVDLLHRHGQGPPVQARVQGPRELPGLRHREPQGQGRLLLRRQPVGRRWP